MKILKNACIVAIFGTLLFSTSCTPENLDNDQTEQQIKKQKITPPTNG